MLHDDMTTVTSDALCYQMDCFIYYISRFNENELTLLRRNHCIQGSFPALPMFMLYTHVVRGYYAARYCITRQNSTVTSMVLPRCKVPTGFERKWSTLYSLSAEPLGDT